MGIEHVILIITTVAGVLKAYFEMKKAKAEAMRADNEACRAGQAEDMLRAAVEGVEEVRTELPERGRQIADKIKKRTEFLGLDSQFHAIVKEVTEGEGDIQGVTNKFSKEKLKKMLED